ncbi:hypothetical protein L1987_38264 [Smallanthus sonchifolius]|uniref:Uncharacterized protein n=1 Tax=Smallanthus sonchifolius TaxID=185202 RepID=A0ACB9HI57_9ASTR|nr:hypothetical protein L1987_38264 [Smallanthus sonchifolius]
MHPISTGISSRRQQLSTSNRLRHGKLMVQASHCLISNSCNFKNLVVEMVPHQHPTGVLQRQHFVILEPRVEVKIEFLTWNSMEDNILLIFIGFQSRGNKTSVPHFTCLRFTKFDMDKYDRMLEVVVMRILRFAKMRHFLYGATSRGLDPCGFVVKKTVSQVRSASLARTPAITTRASGNP